jgi:hypothetical protein
MDADDRRPGVDGGSSSAVTTATRRIGTGEKNKKKGEKTKKSRNYAKVGTVPAGGGGVPFYLLPGPPEAALPLALPPTFAG